MVVQTFLFVGEKAPNLVSRHLRHISEILSFQNLEFRSCECLTVIFQNDNVIMNHCPCFDSDSRQFFQILSLHCYLRYHTVSKNCHKLMKMCL